MQQPYIKAHLRSLGRYPAFSAPANTCGKAHRGSGRARVGRRGGSGTAQAGYLPKDRRVRTERGWSWQHGDG